jgi:preprotein translocase subunit SecA
MDYLQEGVGLRAYAQRDPLVEYQREGFDMFQQMLDGIKEEAVGFLFNLEVQVEEEGEEPPAAEEPKELTAEEFAEQVGKAAGTAAPAGDGKVEIHAKGLGERAPQALQYSQPTIDGAAGSGAVEVGQDSGSATAAAALRTGPQSKIAAGEKQNAPGQKVGSGPSRNAPCPCGSGKKYKKCHGAPGSAPLPE